jgi:hypothetical protein
VIQKQKKKTKQKGLSNLHKKHKKKSSQIFCQKTTNFVQQKLLMGPQKGRTSTNYEPMRRVSTSEHTSLLDLFSKHSYKPDPGIQAQILAPMRQVYILVSQSNVTLV